MKTIIVAPDSFKGSLSAIDAAKYMEQGIKQYDPDLTVVKIPVADGGEGTVQAMVAAAGGKLLSRQVSGPLGDPVTAFFGILGDGTTAVVELAAASGLTLLPDEKKNVMAASSYGTGELIREALDQGCREIIIGLGGSATNDAGVGMAQALGAKFFDAGGREAGRGGQALAAIETFSIEGLDERLKRAKLRVACDVNNPFYGPHGAVTVFSGQKGAGGTEKKLLEAGMKNISVLIRQKLKIDLQSIPGSGAAGGAAGGAVAFLGGKLEPGIDIVLDAVNFADRLRDADLVITGEGEINYQSAAGKAPSGVARLAKRYEVPVLAIGGGLGPGYETLYGQGIDAMASIVPGPLSLAEAQEKAGVLLAAAVQNCMRLLALGGKLK